MKKFLILFFTFLSINFIYSQATCATMAPICSGNISPQPSLVGPNLGSPGCLGSAPNANWYTFQTGFSGNLIFNLQQGNNPPLFNNLDIDYICWGPFTDAQMATNACNLLYDLPSLTIPNNIVACSYSAAAVETITIPNANPGSNYILLITNFSNQAGQFIMSQTNATTPGAGSTNCDVVCGVDLGPTATSVYPSPPAINTISFCNSSISSQILHCNFQNPPANQNSLAYQWFKDGVLQPTLTSKSITVSQSGTWKVRVTHPDCGTPTEDSVIIYFGATPVVNPVPTQLGPLGDCNPTFDLTALIPTLLAPLNPSDFTVSFFTESNYGASLVYTFPVTGNIPNPSAFQPGVDTTIYVRARNNTSPECVDSEEISFLLDVRCINNATAVGNTICTNNTGQLTFTGPPNAVVTFTQGANTYNVTIPASGPFIWNTPTPLTATTIYTLTNVAAGLPVVNTPLTSTATITVNPDNTVSLPSTTPTICINTALPVAITHTTTGATGIGTPTGLPAGVTATWAANTITISGTPTASGTFNYTIPLTGGCGTFNATGTITVTPDNTVTSGVTTTLCINTALLAAITHTTTGATNIGTATGLPPGVLATWASNTITINGTPTASGTFAYTIPLTGGCGSVNATGTITVNPNNTGSAADPSPTCCVNSLLPSFTYNITGATGIGTPIGLPPGVTALWTTNTITISGTPTASGTFNYSIPLTGGCGTFTPTGTITVTPDNTVTSGVTTTLCINTALLAAITHTTTGATGIGTPTGLPAGVAATWLADTITINGTPTASGIFNYSIPLVGGCGGIATGTITVTPDNTVTPGVTTTLCVNTPLTAITHTTTGATGIGTTTTNYGLPTGVTAVWAANTITISGTPSASGTFAYTIPLTGGCGTVNATGTITANVDNTVSLPSVNPTICINTALVAAITHTTTVATGIGTPTGLPTGVTATWAADTITINGTPTVSGVFNYTIPLTGGCGIVNATGTITVTPDNTVTSGVTTTLCINTALLAAITHITTGATGIGTPTGLPAGVAATWASNTITINGTPTVSGIFNYSIPLVGGCGGIATGTITVTPDNTVTPGVTTTLCINTPLTAITHTTTGATGIGTTTTNYGLPTGVTAVWAANTITISGTPSASGTFAYTIPLTGGCGTVNATGTIIVNVDNTVSLPTSTPTVCINTPLTAITHTTTVATGIGTPIGLPAGVTASWLANTITISGTPTASGTFAYTIPLTGGCGTVNATGTITVTPDNTVTPASSAPTLCINTVLPTLTHTTTGATNIGTPTGLPAGVTATWAANTITINGTPTASGTFAYTIPLTGGCGTVNATGTITVTADNTVTAPSGTPTICINTALPVAITHTTTGATGIGAATGLPAGVTASWASNTITISGTPTASGTFAYTIPLTGGCGTFNATGTITVTPDNTVTPGVTTTLCINTALLAAITHITTGATGIGTPTGLPAGVTATWASNTITINGTPTVSGIFNYSIPLTGGCGGIATGTIIVTPNNTVTPGVTTTLCINTPLTAITHTTTGATGIGTTTTNYGLPTGVTAVWAANT
ncbi:beta strand repeat-containing protein, partial [Flavobacterium sp.]|uniref:beta strand repeat-containing protein n=1 Tax=Flavobacterium sp. TaxID=239 RepID=UPI0037C0C432